jgi:alpha-beta hydrolase superfamily lysophospholipase
MKLSLKQRLAVNFYTAKFKTIGLVSPRKAAEKAFELFCTPMNGKPERKEPNAFQHAEKLSFEIEELTIRGWHWKNENNNGKKILICHGFDSCAYKFEKYVSLLKKEGFEVFVFDAPGHGISDGKLINAILYSKVVLKANELFGNFYSIIGHSLGGLAATLAAAKLNDLKKLVLIAPAVETTRAVDNFLRIIELSEEVKQAFIELINEKAQMNYADISVKKNIPFITANTMWLHDTDDTVCPFEDAQKVQQMNLPHVHFYITHSLGHSKIYKEHKVAKDIIHFIVQP